VTQCGAVVLFVTLGFMQYEYTEGTTVPTQSTVEAQHGMGSGRRCSIYDGIRATLFVDGGITQI
jgi:hypothetical protein